MDDDDDVHLCLSCNQTIIGLMNYIVHKKSQCRCKKQQTAKLGEQTQPNSAGADCSTAVSDLTLSYSHQKSFPAVTTGTLTEIVSNNFLTSSVSSQRNYIFSTAGQNETNTETSHSYLSSDKSISNSMDFSTPGMGTLVMPVTSQCFSANSTLAGNNKCQNSVNSFVADLGKQTPSCSLATVNSAVVSLSQSVSLREISPVESQQTTSVSLCSAVPPTSTEPSLSLEIHSPLSRFISANLSPVSVSPNSMMPQTSVGNCEDFFQSLELQSKSHQNIKSGSQGRQPVDDDEMDLDLPISRILSSLDFSSDEDLVDFPLDGSFGEMSDDEASSDHPPSSHTGGKWKPGEGPASRKNISCKKWRKDFYSGAQMGHGGKWKPGMSRGKTKSVSEKNDEKIYKCQGCDITFANRFQYSHHCSTQDHKSRICGKAAGRKGYYCSVCGVSLPSRFSYSHHCRRKSHKYNVKCQQDGYSEMCKEISGKTTELNSVSSSSCNASSKDIGNSKNSKENDTEISSHSAIQKKNSEEKEKITDMTKCDHCRQQFENRAELENHLQMCKENVKTSDRAEREVNNSVEEKVYACQVCSEMFSNSFAYSHHLGLCTAEKPGSENCERTAESKDATKPNDKKAVGVPEQWKSLVIRLFYCSVCNHSFKTRPLFLQHCDICRAFIAQSHGVNDNTVHCCCCSVVFKSDEELSEHSKSTDHKVKESLMLNKLENERGLKDTEVENRSQVTSRQNEQSTEGQGNDSTSQTVERKEQKHECLVCNKSFSRLYDIVRHLLTRFHRNRAINHPQVIFMLQKYHRLLLRLSPYQCGICQFYFNRESDFARHISSKLHIQNCSTIVGQIICTSCKYSSYDHQAIQLHIATESHRHIHKEGRLLCIVKEKKRQIKCQYCGIVMDSRKRMKRHVTYRHPTGIPSKVFVKSKGKNQPQCPTCGKRFFSPSALALHVSGVHLNNKPYKCKLCNKLFKSKLSLSKHSTSNKHLYNMKTQSGEQESNDISLHSADNNSSVLIENDVAGDVADSGLEADDQIEANVSADVNVADEEEKDGDEKMISDKEIQDREAKLDSSMKCIYFAKNNKKSVNDKSYTCDLCVADFSSLDSLRNHVENQHPENLFICTLCRNIFLSRKAFRIHCSGKMHQEQLVRQGTTQTLYKCSQCSMQFTEERWRNFHFQYQHNHLNSEDSLAEIQRGRDQVSQKYGSFLRELYCLPNNAQVTCLVCDKVLKKEYLREHLRQHTGEKPFACKLCDKAFVAHLSLRRHLMCHFGLLERNCEICGKHFKKTDLYKTHMQEHVNRDKGQCHMCDICGLVFPLEKQVVHHMKRHGERKFSCPYKGCAWKFVLKSELNVHIYSHTGEKKYLCDICGNGYATKTRLVRHKRTHTQERNYHCEHCSYKAGSRTHLLRHMRIHLGSKPFKCPYCPYTCNTHENVRKHITKTRKHSGLKIYPCKFCSYGSNTGKDFRNHLLLTHPSEIKGLNLETLSVFTGLYNRSEDVKHVDSKNIIPIPHRKPRVARKQQNNTAKKEENAEVIVSGVNEMDSDGQTVCNTVSYLTIQQQQQTSWISQDRQESESEAAKYLSNGSDLIAFSHSGSNNLIVAADSASHLAGFDHLDDQNVADVVIVSTDY